MSAPKFGPQVDAFPANGVRRPLNIRHLRALNALRARNPVNAQNPVWLPVSRSLVERLVGPYATNTIGSLVARGFILEIATDPADEQLQLTAAGAEYLQHELPDLR